MRSQKKKIAPQTWAWSEILPAVCETDASLRRKLQRGQVKLELGADAGRTRATLWDIARLRVSRHLCDVGFDADRAFAYAELLIDSAYHDLLKRGHPFSIENGERQKFKYAVVLIHQKDVGGVRIVDVDPSDSEAGLRELGLAVSDPRQVVVSIHWLVLDAWYMLPHLPDHVAGWMRASSAKIDALRALHQDTRRPR